jgi:hypothetical protein
VEVSVAVHRLSNPAVPPAEMRIRKTASPCENLRHICAFLVPKAELADR